MCDTALTNPIPSGLPRNSKAKPPKESQTKIWRQNSHRRRVKARNVSFRVSLRWPIHIINSVDKTKLSACNTPHRHSSPVSLETYPLYSYGDKRKSYAYLLSNTPFRNSYCTVAWPWEETETNLERRVDGAKNSATKDKR